jgi:hypothetical protein
MYLAYEVLLLYHVSRPRKRGGLFYGFWFELEPLSERVTESISSASGGHARPVGTRSESGHKLGRVRRQDLATAYYLWAKHADIRTSGARAEGVASPSARPGNTWPGYNGSAPLS